MPAYFGTTIPKKVTIAAQTNKIFCGKVSKICTFVLMNIEMECLIYNHFL